MLSLSIKTINRARQPRNGCLSVLERVVCASPLKRERTIVLRVVRSTQKEVRRCRTRERGSFEKLECFDSYGASSGEELICTAAPHPPATHSNALANALTKKTIAKMELLSRLSPKPVDRFSSNLVQCLMAAQGRFWQSLAEILQRVLAGRPF